MLSRDLVKTLTFASVHFSVAFGVAYAMTGSAPVATGLALVEPLVNTVAFFFHERLWQTIERRSDATQSPESWRHRHGRIRLPRAAKCEAIASAGVTGREAGCWPCRSQISVGAAVRAA